MGRPPLSPEGSAQVAIRIPKHILRMAESIVEERRGVADRATVLREFLAEGAAMLAKKPRK